MMCMPLFKRNMKSGFKLLLIFGLILTMYISVIIYMYNEDLAKLLNEYQSMMPEVMSAVGMSGQTGSLTEFVNTYLNGFLMLVIPMVFTMLLVNSYVMKYVDNGSMACLLATPNSRKKVIFTQLFSIILMEVLLISWATGVGITCAEVMFPGKLDINKYILMNFATLLMQCLVASICFLAACIFNETKGYLACGIGLPLIFYVIQMISNMGGDLEIFKYFTIYTLLPYEDILSGGIQNGMISSMLIIAGAAFFLYGIGETIFVKKDLNI